MFLSYKCFSASHHVKHLTDLVITFGEMISTVKLEPTAT